MTDDSKTKIVDKVTTFAERSPSTVSFAVVLVVVGYLLYLYGESAKRLDEYQKLVITQNHDRLTLLIGRCKLDPEKKDM